MTNPSTWGNTHWLLFSGHRIDAHDRTMPRVPPASEPIAGKMISDAVSLVMERHPADRFHGISSGANGGDMLFLEACRALGVPTDIYLALTAKEFEEVSVAEAGGDWAERFKALLEARPVHILPEEGSSTLNIWQRTNLWMLDSVLSHEGSNITVIVLWDGNAADGPGGTKDMVKQARAVGAHVVHLDAAKLT
jgi:hypothetical protein